MNPIDAAAPLLVRFEADGGRVERHRVALAGLPLSFRITTSPSADVVVATADSVDALLAASDASIVVIDPERLRAGTLAPSGTAVVVPLVRVAALLDDVEQVPDPRLARLCSSVATNAEFRSALLEQLAVVRRLVGSVRSLRLVKDSPSVVHVRADAGANGTVSMAVVVSPVDGEELTADVAARDLRVSFTHHLGHGARPATWIESGPTGDRMAARRYESAERLWWRALSAHLADRTCKLPYDLPALHADVDLLDSLAYDGDSALVVSGGR